LRRLNLFDGMSDAEVESVSRRLRMRHCAAGTSALEGSSERVYLIKQGRVRLYHLSREGQEVTTALLGPGQLFGLGSLFGNNSAATQAQPVQDSYICDAGARDFLQMLTEHPLLMARVMMAMAKQLVRLQETLESVLSQPVSGRLASLIVSMLDQAESSHEGPLLPALSHEELGKMIGATRESVSRTLSDWRRHGIIGNRGRRILIRKLQVLRDRAVESA
jgi:CRP/FNR family transcriptional regulator, cyclic AMP receptor protein